METPKTDWKPVIETAAKRDGYVLEHVAAELVESAPVGAQVLVKGEYQRTILLEVEEVPVTYRDVRTDSGPAVSHRRIFLPNGEETRGGRLIVDEPASNPRPFHANAWNAHVCRGESESARPGTGRLRRLKFVKNPTEVGENCLDLRHLGYYR